jgi:hypothetical protein
VATVKPLSVSITAVPAAVILENTAEPGLTVVATVEALAMAAVTEEVLAMGEVTVEETEVMMVSPTGDPAKLPTLQVNPDLKF